jgi:hypothetical protein
MMQKWFKKISKSPLQLIRNVDQAQFLIFWTYSSTRIFIHGECSLQDLQQHFRGNTREAAGDI